MLHIDEIIKQYNANAGCTCPALVTLSSGKQAVFKYPKNPQGSIVLFNEYFSSSIAKEINVTCPPFGIALADESTVISKECKNSNKDASCFWGVGFYSEYIHNVSMASPLFVKRASNINETARIILLDEIVKNTDRHKSNIQIGYSKGNNTLYAIDYSHAFGDPDWDSKTLLIGDCHSPRIWNENKDLYEMLISAGGIVTPETLKNESALIRECIDEIFLDSILDSIPADWKESIGTERLSLAKQYVISRVDCLEIISDMILKERGM